MDGQLGRNSDDLLLGTVPPLELGRAEIAKAGMPALGAVEGLDVVEDGQPGVGPGAPAAAIDELRLETAKELRAVVVLMLIRWLKLPPHRSALGGRPRWV